MARRRSAAWASAREPRKLFCFELHGWGVPPGNPRIFCECSLAPSGEFSVSMRDHKYLCRTDAPPLIGQTVRHAA